MDAKNDYDDEEALKWATLQKLPTYDRLRKVLIRNSVASKDYSVGEVDTKHLGIQEKKDLLERLMSSDGGNKYLLHKIRERFDRVGIELPKVEVRFEHLHVDAKVDVGSRALPTFFNFVGNVLENFLTHLCVLPNGKKHFSILRDVSGIIKPGRMTLLLGPPGCGKTTLMQALAGKLDRVLEVSGNVTYNGHRMDEFVPQKTAAYVSQNDCHIPEMTVRETLAFSARCQGVGSHYEMLVELLRREKEANINPDLDIDLYMKAAAMEGQEASVVTDYVLKILGLETCADTVVGSEMKRGISGGQKKRVTTGEMLCPDRKGVADFLQEVTSKQDQEQYWLHRDEPYRELLLMKRNTFVYIFKSTQLCIMAFITMTIFLKTEMHRDSLNDGNIYLGALFFSVHPNVGRLFKQYILLLLVDQIYSALFRCIAAMGRSTIVASTFGAFALLIHFALGGFVLSRANVNKWWIWGYWTSPMMYGMNAIAVNEFLGHQWSHVLPNTKEPLGVVILKSRGFFPSPSCFFNPIGKPQAIIPEESYRARTIGGIDPSSCEDRGDQIKRGSPQSSTRTGILLPFEPHSITFDEIKYSVDMPKEMKEQSVFEDKLMLLKGNDIHSPHVTVHESLLYSAWLRLPQEVDSGSRKMFVEEVMELVELKALRNALVGLPGVSGLSTEQRKRLTIAVELVANPSIVFMDEPTSGLDARAAAIVMRTVRNTVNTGRTVVCTIHQPSIDIFEAFDELLLLKQGGLELYVGPLGLNSCKLIKYFEDIQDQYRRNKALIKELIRFLFTTFIALMFGTIFWDLGAKRRTRQDLFNSMGSMYSAVMFVGLQNAATVQPVVAVERTVFYRERAAGMYSSLAYALAQVLVEVPYIFLQTVVYGVIVYSMIGFEWSVEKFFCWIVLRNMEFIFRICSPQNKDAILGRPGANILLPRPGYPLHEARAAFSNIEIRRFDLPPLKGWEVDLGSVEAVADGNTVAIVIVNLRNPCGNILAEIFG
ncbi:hypothetical protein POM88_036359 [Heracleum sosnowskyi]|uniref:ABC transporter domain-containing protein n=1 Tax=Heracleum sosnowskyi TaxID=360622 RepID=A0AAD8HN06_9APIA|nr:hypothetical protein POM88_036359 [Heracleum sosnowskyi]